MPGSDLIAAHDRQHAQRGRIACQGIAERPQILEAFEAAYAASGAVGEVRNAKILYLALTSRLLPRPVSVALKGPRSAGKSFAIETELQFFPSEAVHCVTAISDRALAYTDAEFGQKELHDRNRSFEGCRVDVGSRSGGGPVASIDPHEAFTETAISASGIRPLLPLGLADVGDRCRSVTGLCPRS